MYSGLVNIAQALFFKSKYTLQTQKGGRLVGRRQQLGQLCSCQLGPCHQVAAS